MQRMDLSKATLRQLKDIRKKHKKLRKDTLNSQAFQISKKLVERKVRKVYEPNKEKRKK